MAEARKMRSFFKKDNNSSRRPKEDQMKDKPCFACGEFGKVKAAMASGNQVLVAGAVDKQADQSREWDLLASLCQRAPTDERSASEVYMVGVRAGAMASDNTHATCLPHDTFWSMREFSRAVILDLGCMRNVAGLQWANDIVMNWRQEGRWFRIIEENETFKFGDGNTLESKYRLQFEATFGAKRVLLAFSVVPGSCPPLLSKKSHSLLGVVIDCVNDTLSSKKLGIKAYGLSTTEGGHYMMKVNEFQHVATDHEPLNLQMDVNDEVGLILDNAGSVAQEAFNAQSSSFPDVLLHGGEPTESSSMPDLRQVGHRTRDCPEASQDEDFVRISTESMEKLREQEIREEDTRMTARKEAPKDISRQAQHGESQEGSQRIGGGASSIAADSNFTGQADGVFYGSCGGPDTRRDCHDWKEEGEAGQVKGKETGDCSLDRGQGGLSVLGQCMEQRPGDEHHEERAESPSSSAVEEGGVADACEKGSGDRGPWQAEVEAQSPLDQPDDWDRGGNIVGPLRSNEAEDEGAGCGAPVLKMERPQRGLQQRFKESINGLRQVFAAVHQVCQQEGQWMALEIFAGCCRFTQVAASREGWCILPPVDLQLGQESRAGGGSLLHQEVWAGSDHP